MGGAFDAVRALCTRPLHLTAVALSVVVLVAAALTGPEATAADDVETVRVGGHPTGVALGESIAWVVDRGDHTLSMVNVITLDREGDRIGFTAAPQDLVFGDYRLVGEDSFLEGRLWVANTGDSQSPDVPGDYSVSAITPPEPNVLLCTGTGEDRTCRLPPANLGEWGISTRPVGVTLGDELLWVATRDALWQIAPSEGAEREVRAVIDLADAVTGDIRVTDIATGEGAVWVANRGDDTVLRVDPSSGELLGEPIAVGDTPVAIAVGEGSVWVVNRGDDTVSRIDPATGQLVGEPIAVGDAPVAIAVDGVVWVANRADGTLSIIDPVAVSAPSTTAPPEGDLFPGVNTPDSVEDCLDGGWQEVRSGGGQRFKSEDDCVSWVRLILE